MNDSSAIERNASSADSTAGELIERLQNAPDGNRGLDAWIGAHVGYRGWTPQSWQEALNSGALWEPLAAPEGCPHYTTSLDSAVSLVPADHNYAMGDLNEHDNPWCCVTTEEDSFMDFEGTAATIPLAICIAALKARTPAVSPESNTGSTVADEAGSSHETNR